LSFFDCDANNVEYRLLQIGGKMKTTASSYKKIKTNLQIIMADIIYFV